MFDDLCEERTLLLERLDEKGADPRKIGERVEELDKLLGILDDPQSRRLYKDDTLEEWERAFEQGGPLPKSLTEPLHKSRKT